MGEGVYDYEDVGDLEVVRVPEKHPGLIGEDQLAVVRRGKVYVSGMVIFGMVWWEM